MCPFDQLNKAHATLPVNCPAMTGYQGECQHKCKEGHILREGSLIQQCQVNDPPSEWANWVPIWRWWGQTKNPPVCYETHCGQAPMISYGDASACDDLGHNRICKAPDIKCMNNYTLSGQLRCDSGAFVEFPTCYDGNLEELQVDAVSMVIDIEAPNFKVAKNFAKELIALATQVLNMPYITIPAVYSRGVSKSPPPNLPGDFKVRRLAHARLLSRKNWLQYTMTLFVPIMPDATSISSGKLDTSKIEKGLTTVMEYYKSKNKEIEQKETDGIMPKFHLFGDENTPFRVTKVSAHIAKDYKGTPKTITDTVKEELPNPKAIWIVMAVS